MSEIERVSTGRFDGKGKVNKATMGEIICIRFLNQTKIAN